MEVNSITGNTRELCVCEYGNLHIHVRRENREKPKPLWGRGGMREAKEEKKNNLHKFRKQHHPTTSSLWLNTGSVIFADRKNGWENLQAKNASAEFSLLFIFGRKKNVDCECWSPIDTKCRLLTSSNVYFRLCLISVYLCDGCTNFGLVVSWN